MNCIIIEDEIPAQQVLKNYLKRLPELQLSGCFNSIASAKSFFDTSTTDLLFLDINLPDQSGLDFIKMLPQPPAVIMTTAYPNYAASSFELDTIVDYLVKPFSFDRFIKAIKKAQKTNQATTEVQLKKIEHFFINVDKALHKIVLKDLIYIQSERNYVTLKSTNGKLSYLDSLQNWKQKLPKEFIQVHKSYLVNTHYIDKLMGNLLYVNSEKIPIGRTFKEALLQKLNINS